MRVEPFHIWLHRVTMIAKIQDSDLDRIISGWRQRDRVRRWYLDDMTADMAGKSLGDMVRDAIRAGRKL